MLLGEQFFKVHWCIWKVKFHWQLENRTSWFRNVKRTLQIFLMRCEYQNLSFISMWFSHIKNGSLWNLVFITWINKEGRNNINCVDHLMEHNLILSYFNSTYKIHKDFQDPMWIQFKWGYKIFNCIYSVLQRYFMQDTRLWSFFWMLHLNVLNITKNKYINNYTSCSFQDRFEKYIQGFFIFSTYILFEIARSWP